jgi:hypothetical protein
MRPSSKPCTSNRGAISSCSIVPGSPAVIPTSRWVFSTMHSQSKEWYVLITLRYHPTSIPHRLPSFCRASSTRMQPTRYPNSLGPMDSSLHVQLPFPWVQHPLPPLPTLLLLAPLPKVRPHDENPLQPNHVTVSVRVLPKAFPTNWSPLPPLTLLVSTAATPQALIQR